MSEPKSARIHDLPISAHRLLKDLIEIDRPRILFDLLASASLGWFFLFLSAKASFPFVATLLFLGSTLAAYRSQVFIHEVAHLRSRFPALESVYNWTVGYLNRVPSYLYYPHSAHHSLKTFASAQDPEYRTLRGPSKQGLLYKPLLLSLIFPWYKMIRFGLLPLSYPFLSESALTVVYQRFATLRLNPQFRRTLRDRDDIELMKREDLITCAFTWLLFGLVGFGFLSLKFFLFLQLSTSIGCAVNMYRALLNHRYSSEAAHESYEAAMLDSISLKSAWWNELWAPLGLSYHCTHHMLPSVPYYNLREAHERLWTDRELGNLYQKCSESDFIAALSALSERLR